MVTSLIGTVVEGEEVFHRRLSDAWNVESVNML